MTEIWLLGGAVAAGYVLAVYTWPALRARADDLDADIAALKARAAALEAKLDAFGKRIGG